MNLSRHVIIGSQHFGGPKNSVQKYVFVNNSCAFPILSNFFLVTIVEITMLSLTWKKNPKKLDLEGLPKNLDISIGDKFT